MNQGLVYVFTGNGKGKTSAALGVAMRALAHGWNVDWVALYKEASWNISEFSLPGIVNHSTQQNFTMHILGKGFYLPENNDDVKQASSTIKTASVGKAKVIDDDTPEEHRLAAQAALQKAQEILQQDTPPEVLVLDEICNALHDKLLTWKAVQSVLELRNSTHLILTGRDALPKLIQYADLVSSIENVKHPFDSGALAVKGLDF